MENNWKTFYIDTNVAWGLIESKEQWEKILEETAKFPNFLNMSHVKEHFLATTRREFNTYNSCPYFSFPRKDGRETLAEFLGELI